MLENEAFAAVSKISKKLKREVGHELGKIPAMNSLILEVLSQCLSY
jgi:uncharacterized protein (DUF2164 family)